MTRIYDAVLNGNRLEWQTTAPAVTGTVRVQVTLETSPSDGPKMAAALEGLSQLNAFADIADPVAWQRDLRTDRPLPGRVD
jgi:hypothetical protein